MIIMFNKIKYIFNKIKEKLVSIDNNCIRLKK